ncbi:MAG: NAD-dependent epimerase/dehydratase family protein [Terriglobia bacterium]
MRVLVTGAAGFIGSHVTRHVVQEGHEVTAVILPGESTGRLTDLIARLSVVPLDLRDSGAVREFLDKLRPELALHLAWYAVPSKYWTAPENLDCVTMTINLARALSEVSCRRLVAAGTCAEYDWDYGFLSEDTTPLRPRTLYGVCKNATRAILESFCPPAGLSFAWTRFFHLYGPGEPQERLVPSVIRALLRGETARCSSGRQIRDFMHVRDVASAVWAVAVSQLSGAVNVGSGVPSSLRSIVEIIAGILGGKRAVEWGAIAEDPQEPPLLVADVRKLFRETGWRPALTLEDGLRETVTWWRGQP